MPDYDPQRGRSRGRDDEGPAPVDALLGPDPEAPTAPGEPGADVTTSTPVERAPLAKTPAKKTPAKKAAAKKAAAKKAPAKKAAAKKAAKKAPAKKAAVTKAVAPVDEPDESTSSPTTTPEPEVPLAPAAAAIADVSVTGTVVPPPEPAAAAPTWSEPRPVVPPRSRKAPAVAVVALIGALVVLWALLRRRRHTDEA